MSASFTRIRVASAEEDLKSIAQYGDENFETMCPIFIDRFRMTQIKPVTWPKRSRPLDDSSEVDLVDFSVTGPHDSRYRFVMAALILAAHFCVGLNVFAVSPVLLLVIEDLNISRTTASLLVALPLLISAVFGLPGSVLVMKLGLRRAFILGWAAMGLSGVSRDHLSQFIRASARCA